MCFDVLEQISIYSIKKSSHISDVSLESTLISECYLVAVICVDIY